MPGERTVTRLARRWAASPLDSYVHLLLEGGPLSGVLTARCGHQLTTVVNQHDQPPPGPPCEWCRLAFLADFTTGDSAHSQTA
jgi:hypothetical protein